jgi:Rieske 2Fe-2S family protein
MTQRAVSVGDVGALLVRHDGRVRMFANTCRHRGHELLPDGDSSQRRSIVCPYHAWSYDLSGALQAAPGFRDDDDFRATEHSLVELPVTAWGGWLFGHALHPLGAPQVPPFAEHLGEMDRLLAPYRTKMLVVAARHTYEVAANWKVVAENYHECYHCPLIHPELCQVSPPDSGENYDLPGAWIGGAMELRDGMATMSLTGELAATPLPGVDPRRVEYLHLLPNLLVSAHPDYVMTHRLVPLAPDRTWLECSWLVLPDDDGTVPDAAAAAEFWDLTNRQDWAACESVQRGLASPHFRPGPFAPNEDGVAQLVRTLGRAYVTGRLAAG